jgi:hypothetical protein
VKVGKKKMLKKLYTSIKYKIKLTGLKEIIKNEFKKVKSINLSIESKSIIYAF